MGGSINTITDQDKGQEAAVFPSGRSQPGRTSRPTKVCLRAEEKIKKLITHPKAKITDSDGVPSSLGFRRRPPGLHTSIVDRGGRARRPGFNGCRRGARAQAPPSSTETALARLSSLDNGRSRLLYLYAARAAAARGGGLDREQRGARSRRGPARGPLHQRVSRRSVGSLLIGDCLLEYRGERFERRPSVHYYKDHELPGALDGASTRPWSKCRRLNHRLQVIPRRRRILLRRRSLPPVPDREDLRDDREPRRRRRLVPGRARVVSRPRIRLTAPRCRRGWSAMPRRPPARWAKTSDAERMGARRRMRRDPGEPNAHRLPRVRPRSDQGREQSGAADLQDEITEHMDRDAYARKLCTRRDDSGIPDTTSRSVLAQDRAAGAAHHSRQRRFARVYAVRSDSAGAADDEAMAEATRAANLEVLATKSFEEDRGAILLRAVTRALLKYLATRVDQGKSDEAQVAKQLVNLAGVLTESATRDAGPRSRARSWSRAWTPNPDATRIEVDLFGPSRRRARLPGVRRRRGPRRQEHRAEPARERSSPPRPRVGQSLARSMLAPSFTSFWSSAS